MMRKTEVKKSYRRASLWNGMKTNDPSQSHNSLVMTLATKDALERRVGFPRDVEASEQSIGRYFWGLSDAAIRLDLGRPSVARSHPSPDRANWWSERTVKVYTSNP
jgi:hypothetical protein